jgi:hypothetical protein
VTQKQLRQKAECNRATFPPPKISADHSLVLRPGTREERQHVELFCTETTRVMAGLFRSDFWEHFLPQLSFAEPVIRHTVAALSAAYTRKIRLRASDPSVKSDRFVVQQYNKAISHLLEHLSSPHHSIDIVLIACCLFIYLEMVRGNFKQAFDHLEAGFKILNSRSKSPSPSTISSDRIARELNNLFSRANINLFLQGSRPISYNLSDGPTVENLPDTPKQPFHSLESARDSLIELMHKSLRFIYNTSSESDRHLRLQLEVERRGMQRELEEWRASFDQLLITQVKSKKKGTLSDPDPRGPLLLSCHHRNTLVRIKSLFSRDAMIFDEFTADFEAIVAEVKALMEHSKAVTTPKERTFDTQPRPHPPSPRLPSKQDFYLDLGIIPGVSWAAMRCRMPLLRRKAIRLLELHHSVEGTLNSLAIVRLAKLVVDVEEANLQHLPLEQRIPEDKDRVYDSYQPDDLDPDKFLVVLTSKPYGPDGDWHFRKEWLTLH